MFDGKAFLLSTELQNPSLAVSSSPTFMIKLPVPQNAHFRPFMPTGMPDSWNQDPFFFFLIPTYISFVLLENLYTPLKTQFKPFWRKVLYDIFRQDKSLQLLGFHSNLNFTWFPNISSLLLPASWGGHSTTSYHPHPVCAAYLDLPRVLQSCQMGHCSLILQMTVRLT